MHVHVHVHVHVQAVCHDLSIVSRRGRYVRRATCSTTAPHRGRRCRASRRSSAACCRLARGEHGEGQKALTARCMDGVCGGGGRVCTFMFSRGTWDRESRQRTRLYKLFTRAHSIPNIKYTTTIKYTQHCPCRHSIQTNSEGRRPAFMPALECRSSASATWTCSSRRQREYIA